VSHRNGDAIDTLYLNVVKQDQDFINAMMKFGFTERKVGQGTYCKKLTNVQPFKDHDSHLHCGSLKLKT
jgi:hypothetical protein